METEVIPQSEQVLKSNRYKITEKKPLGQGYWGAVYRGKDVRLDKEVAIKVLQPSAIARKQMEYREITETTAMEKEAAELTACSHIVPRRFEEDATGRPFIVMPLCKLSLEERIGDTYAHRSSLDNKTLTEEFVMTTMQDVAVGLKEMHTVLRRTHGDVKPGNIMFSQSGRAMLSDLGTSTYLAFGQSPPRDNMGHLYTRAPECFKKDSHPRYQSDVWAFGSLAYRLFTGKYILEDEINNAVDPALFIEQLGTKAGNDIVFSKISKNIPYDLRKLLRQCLTFEEYRRISNGEELVDKLHRTLNSRGTFGKISRYFKHISIATWAAGILGVCIYGGLSDKAKPKDLPTYIETGDTIIGNPIKGGQSVFKQEKIPHVRHLSGIIPGEGLVEGTADPYIEHITRGYMGATQGNRGLGWTISTPYQQMLYQAKIGIAPTTEQLREIETDIKMINHAVKYAIQHCKNDDGTIDLEDVCVGAYLGMPVVHKAKEASGSPHYAIYRNAVDANGKRIISLKDVAFIEEWRGYINSR